MALGVAMCYSPVRSGKDGKVAVLEVPKRFATGDGGKAADICRRLRALNSGGYIPNFGCFAHHQARSFMSLPGPEQPDCSVPAGAAFAPLPRG